MKTSVLLIFFIVTCLIEMYIIYLINKYLRNNEKTKKINNNDLMELKKLLTNNYIRKFIRTKSEDEYLNKLILFHNIFYVSAIIFLIIFVLAKLLTIWLN
jgi:hypothetical protein